MSHAEPVLDYRSPAADSQPTASLSAAASELFLTLFFVRGQVIDPVASCAFARRLELNQNLQERDIETERGACRQPSEVCGVGHCMIIAGSFRLIELD